MQGSLSLWMCQQKYCYALWSQSTRLHFGAKKQIANTVSRQIFTLVLYVRRTMHFVHPGLLLFFWLAISAPTHVSFYSWQAIKHCECTACGMSSL
jgi:hypothetical protein